MECHDSAVHAVVYLCTIADVDECFEETDFCNQTCVNINGSYYCTCERGYRRYKNTECEGEICHFAFY